MVSKVQKWGNSQGLRLPKHILATADIAVGDSVEVTTHEGRIVITKVAKRKFDLAEMVAQMPRKYQVVEDSFGNPVGKEVW
ncbi:MAG: AbrB/MazE/SpoVT family DNA-binding domain-containing protein [Pirellula sp.]